MESKDLKVTTLENILVVFWQFGLSDLDQSGIIVMRKTHGETHTVVINLAAESALITTKQIWVGSYTAQGTNTFILFQQHTPACGEAEYAEQRGPY